MDKKALMEELAGKRRVFCVGGVDFAMRWIPAGQFLMGAGEDDEEAADNEKPQHEVTITRGFWMGETPVTQGQYQTIMEKNSFRLERSDGVEPVDAVHWYDAATTWSRCTSTHAAPVNDVHWYDAAAFTNNLSELEGLSACFVGAWEKMQGVGNKSSDYVECKGWRLPTEAEWEYACRGGTDSPRYGSLAKIAWFLNNSGGDMHFAGKKQANAWGLRDTLGNVWEWCYDWFGPYPTQAVTNPAGAARGVSRTVRGGGWSSHAEYVRAAQRRSNTPTHRSANLGFRVVRSGL